MKNFIIVFFILFFMQSMNAQVSENSELFLQLKSRDSLLFDRGFNHCEIEQFEDFISENLEFYHDQGGLSTNKLDFLKAIRKNICANPKKKPVRKLQKGSLQVYPLYDNGELYGAIQKGIHDFFIKEPGKELYLTSTAKFTHIWILENKEWILTRVLSYDHQSP